MPPSSETFETLTRENASLRRQLGELTAGSRPLDFQAVFEATPGKGSTFWLSLPLAPAG